MAVTQETLYVSAPSPPGVDNNNCPGQRGDTFLPDFDGDERVHALSTPNQDRHITLDLIQRMGNQLDDTGDDWLVDDGDLELSDCEDNDNVSVGGSDEDDSDKEPHWNDIDLDDDLEGELKEELVPCRACIEGVANQQGHMYPGGCLYLK
jgi:hypothetical protein